MSPSVAEWLACWTQAQKARVQIAVATLSGNGLRQTAHTHCASVHQAAKLVAALLRVAGVGLAESNGSLPPGLWLTSPAGWWLPRTGISSGTLCSVVEYGHLYFLPSAVVLWQSCRVALASRREKNACTAQSLVTTSSCNVLLRLIWVWCSESCTLYIHTLTVDKSHCQSSKNSFTDSTNQIAVFA